MFFGSMAMLELLFILAVAAVLVGAAWLLSRGDMSGWRIQTAWYIALLCGLLLGLNVLLIKGFQLTLRDTPTLFLLVVGGLAAVLWLLMCENVYLLQRLTGLGRTSRRLLKGSILLATGLLCAFVLLAVLALLIFGDIVGTEIRTVEYGGQLLVERQTGFLDLYYVYHACHGPLLRGTEILYQGATPLC